VVVTKVHLKNVGSVTLESAAEPVYHMLRLLPLRDHMVRNRSSNWDTIDDDPPRSYSNNCFSKSCSGWGSMLPLQPITPPYLKAKETLHHICPIHTIHTISANSSKLFPVLKEGA